MTAGVYLRLAVGSFTAAICKEMVLSTCMFPPTCLMALKSSCTRVCLKVVLYEGEIYKHYRSDASWQLRIAIFSRSHALDIPSDRNNTSAKRAASAIIRVCWSSRNTRKRTLESFTLVIFPFPSSLLTARLLRFA